MDEHILNELMKEDQTDFHKQILQDSKALVEMSRKTMTDYYDTWSANDDVYRGIRVADESDRQARERGEPEKQILPLTYSQTQTFIAFCFSLFYQREDFFELLPMNVDSHQAAKLGQALLRRDLNINCFESKLYQFLLDIARFGVGVLKTGWVREQALKTVQKQLPGLNFLGFNITAGKTVETKEWVTKFLGNRIYNVSPFRWSPDTRLPISRFQEGEFVASEDEYTHVTLKQMEHDGLIAGVKYVSQNDSAVMERRTTGRFASLGKAVTDPSSTGSGQSANSYILTEVQRTLIPKDYMIEGKPLGPEDYPVKYNIWYLNDSRVVKCEPLNYAHDQYTYDVAEFSPDMHNLLNKGLADTIDMLQSTISWFINSRITNVRKVIQNYLVVDPAGVEMKDLSERRPVIRLKEGAANRGVDKYIQQLQLQDVTASHISDVEFLEGMVQLVTGISDNLLGQFHTGRRSATEARNVYSGAASRLKMIATLIFRTGLDPLGRKMLSNLREGIDEDTVVSVAGMEALFKAPSFIANQSTLAGAYDFEIFDGTLPSEKASIAQTLQDVLTALMASPDAAIALQMDPRAMLLEMMEMRGVRNPARFTLAQVPQNTEQQQQPGNVTALPSGAQPPQPNEPQQQPASIGDLVSQ